MLVTVFSTFATDKQLHHNEVPLSTGHHWLPYSAVTERFRCSCRLTCVMKCGMLQAFVLASFRGTDGCGKHGYLLSAVDFP